ncbi:MAG: hypothetical protein SFW08_10730 [Gemmatimonadaceae bacterium]|nr:hypothetical protein [Gemmatimonadaceae bacterium]
MNVRRSLTALVAAGSLMTLAGCGVIGATASSYAVTPQGLEVREQELRSMLPYAGRDSAARVVPPDLAPRDALLRALYDGTWAYYAGEWDRASAGFVAAADLAEDRYTKSITQNAAALLTNDRALSYTPGHTERLLTHYYGALAFIGKGDTESAAVEARRLGAMLEKLAPESSDRDRSLRAVLRLVSGAVFEAAGEANDADVSYRNARALLGADSLQLPGRTAIPADSGDVLVLVETGWVAHKVAQELVIPVYGSEARAFSDSGNAAARLGVAATLAGRTVLLMAARPDQGIWWVDGQPMVVNSWGGVGVARPLDKDGYMLKLSWPVMRRSSAARSALTAVASSPSPGMLGGLLGSTTSGVVADLNDAAAADLSRDRNAILTRTIVRQAVKFAAVQAGEAKATKKWGDLTGSIVGGLLNAAGAALERADTRGWWLLPAGISAVRVRLPVGEQPIAAAVGIGGRDLGSVTVRPGRLTVVSRRIWSGQAAALPTPATLPAGPSAETALRDR